MIKMKDVISEVTNSEEEAKLFRAVVRQVGDWESMQKYPEDYCDASGGISGFISYYDTERFAKRQLINILYVLNEFEQEMGEPLKKYSNNLLNWCAWFAVEHIANMIVRYKEDL